MNSSLVSGFVAHAPLVPGTWVGRAVSSRRPPATHCVAAPAGPGSSRATSSMPNFPDRRRAPQRGPGGPGGPSRPYSDRRGGGGPPRGGRFGGDRDQKRAPRRPIPPGVKTYTECGKCSAVYEITAAELGEGRKVQCAVCDNTWFQRPDSLRWLREGSSFKEYPMERKNELMAERAERGGFRRDRAPGGRQTPGGPGGGGSFGMEGSDRRGAYGGPRRGDRDEGPRRFQDNRAPPRGPGRGGDGSRPQRAGNGQHSVFIGNIPFTITLGELEGLLESAGGVERVSLVTDPSGRSKGFAFADMKSADDVNHCVDTLNGYEMGGRQLTVRVGRKK